MGLLKDLDRHLKDFLESANPEYGAHVCSCSLHEEFLCCCERVRHAIKEFRSQGDDIGKVSDCFPVAADALGDLHWCLEKIDKLETQCRYGRVMPKSFDIERVLFPLWWALQLRKTVITVCCWDAARNGGGSAQFPPGLNVDDLGEIELSSPLGNGSQGTVYKAMWKSRSGTEYSSELGRGGAVYKDWAELVAVKEVSSETWSEGLEALQSMVRSSDGRHDSGSTSNRYSELNVLKTLNHPNIVELKGYTRKACTGEGKYGLVMELMDGSLGLLIEQEKLSDLEKVDTLLQVARGMHFLHMVGIMHRDLKPGNILIGELKYLPPNARGLKYVVAKLADFGLSKGLSKQEDLAVDGAGLHTSFQGTTFYMAPEVRNDESARYAMPADVFSFGTTCFNVLTGKETLFTRNDHPLKREEFYRRIKKGDLDELFDIKYGQSEMALLVRQCWCLDPQKRPTFLKICQILEDEKRRILCSSTPTSQVSPSRWINEVGPSVYSLGATNEVDDSCQTEHFDEIQYLHNLGGKNGKVYIGMWRGVHLVVVKEFSEFDESWTSGCPVSFKMLNHPNVVELKGYTRNQAGKMSGVVMELMKCSLRDVIEVMPISELASIDVLLQVARGMEFLCAKGILHLGLKPANILIGRSHQNATGLEYVVAKITDFSFYRELESSRSPANFSITVKIFNDAAYRQANCFYMAPELYNDYHACTEFSDVFSFGTMCFNVLTGKEIPYTGECQDPLQASEFYRRIARRDLKKLLQKCGESSRMTDLVRECWHPDPYCRPRFEKVCRILEEEKRQILAEEEKGCQILEEEKRCRILEEEKRRILAEEEKKSKSGGAIQRIYNLVSHVFFGGE